VRRRSTPSALPPAPSLATAAGAGASASPSPSLLLLPTAPTLLTYDAAAAATGCQVDDITYLLRSGQLPKYPLPRVNSVSLSQLKVVSVQAAAAQSGCRFAQGVSLEEARLALAAAAATLAPAAASAGVRAFWWKTGDSSSPSDLVVSAADADAACVALRSLGLLVSTDIAADVSVSDNAAVAPESGPPPANVRALATTEQRPQQLATLAEVSAAAGVSASDAEFVLAAVGHAGSPGAIRVGESTSVQRFDLRQATATLRAALVPVALVLKADFGIDDPHEVAELVTQLQSPTLVGQPSVRLVPLRALGTASEPVLCALPSQLRALMDWMLALR
jgi:hypothetical protein